MNGPVAATILIAAGLVIGWVYHSRRADQFHGPDPRMNTEVGDWITAADALRRNDAHTVADRLYRRDLPDRAAYQRLVTLSVIGAVACAYEIARIHGQTPGQAPANSMYTLEAPDPHWWEPSNANQRVAAQAATVAANGDSGMVGDLILAHLRPHSLEEAGVVLELLRLYVDLADTPPGGAR